MRAVNGIGVVTNSGRSLQRPPKAEPKTCEIATLMNDEVHVFVGEELGNRYLEPVGLVCINFQAGKQKGTLGVIGPSRLNYPHVVPMVRYFGNLISEISQDWQ